MRGFMALFGRELKKWYKDPFILAMTMVQPVLWLVLFGKAFNLSSLAGGQSGQSFFHEIFGTTDYFSYMAAGMLAFVVVFVTMVSGMSIVWDRRTGILAKIMSTPVARSSIALSKVLSTVVRGLAQASLVLATALILGLRLVNSFNPLSLIVVFGALVLLSVGLSSIFVAVAVRARHPETPGALMNLLNLPLLFASNALFPIRFMPDWIQIVAWCNPVTYTTDVVRQMLLQVPDWTSVGADFVLLGVFAVMFGWIGIAISSRFLSR